ncbi:hypothetical protein DYB37_004234 [Aphanomyces astaci]|uniref:Major facilitator superfamily (MFS) profile domain-containing protein n=1 Tax=Aphanomyces astaci TaxID=112090 RepID=A0A3R6WV98_APHAT|nr:hypothetical protein DYB35_002872 [Aphanomyces astaci]RHZ18240.1 hypothetical protein DYB37_004234 [Aphanomyces astaci]
MSTCSARLTRHWQCTPVPKSPGQIAAEQHLLCLPWFHGHYIVLSTRIRFNRWILFGAAFVSQFCVGSLYAWSIYNIPMDTYIFGNPNEEKAVYTFYMACVSLGSAATIVGPWLERNGPKCGLLLGTSCFLVGYMVATISLYFKSIAGVYVGYGVIAGFGIGVNYITPASALIKWFPDMRGTAAGFAVGGFGASSLLWSKVYLPAIDAMGLPTSFLCLGGIMSCIMFACALVMRTPPPGYSVGGLNMHGMTTADPPASPHVNPDDALPSSPHTAIFELEADAHRPHGDLLDEDEDAHQVWLKQIKATSLLDSLFSVDFACIHITLLGNIVLGLVVLSRISSMATTIFHQSKDQAATLVSINGLFTCSGQILVPMLSDVLVRRWHLRPPFARKCIFVGTLVAQLGIVATLPYTLRTENFTVFRVQVWVLLVCYGGAFGTVAAFLTDMFGAHNIGGLHGCVLTAWSLAGLVGGLGFTLHFNHLVNDLHLPLVDAYVENLYWVAGVIVVGLLAVLAVRTSAKDRFAPGYQYSICGTPIVRVGHKNLPPR